MNEAEFLSLKTEQVREIVQKRGRPRAALLILDGTRRAGYIFQSLNPADKNFEKNLYSTIHRRFMSILRMVFDHGLKACFLPLLKHENFERGKNFSFHAVLNGLSYPFKSEEWMEFYREYDVRVNVYGDLEFVGKCGYPQVREWAYEVEQATANHSSHHIYYGVACSNRYEIPRLMSMAVEFYIRKSRMPTLEEMIKAYYGTDAPPVDLMIRHVEVRDSDIQPPLISGHSSQMYFPVIPGMYLSQRVYRRILYDYLYERLITCGKRTYKKSPNTQEVEWLKQYYQMNEDAVLGLGKRIGDLWVPLPQVRGLD